MIDISTSKTVISYPKIILFIALVAVMLAAIPAASALDKVISNSADWRDVYSSMLYASIIGKKPGLFLTSARHGTILLYSIPKDTNGTLILSSRTQPYVVNYKAVMDAQGYTGVEEIVSNTINLDLAKRLAQEKNIKKFIIVDDAYGYNALSAAAYAVADNYYVIFANDRNIGAVDNFLNSINPTKVIIFGQVDEVVKTRLAAYNPETINTGDRFENNIELVKRFQNIRNSKQTLMSNGEFIESSIMAGDDPVLFIGRGAVPPQVEEYIKSSGFQVAVLIGNELINQATAIRRQIGISVFVKFAQGARTPTGAIATVEDLDKFPMPKYTLNLELYSIMYNKATHALWVTYHNAAGLGTYFKGTITVYVDGNKTVIGDQNPIFIDKNQYKTITYDLMVDGANITADIYTLFGEGTRSLENVLDTKGVSVESVEILDDAIINVTNIAYNKGKGQFVVTIKNIGTVDSYVNAELLELYVNGEYITVGATNPVLIQPGKEGTLIIPAVLSDSDIANNPIVKVKGYYGERENSLVKTTYGEYAFQFVRIDIVYYALIAVVIILILLVFFGRKKCKQCGTKNMQWSKKCQKCGALLSHKHHQEHAKHATHHEHHHESPTEAPQTEEQRAE